MRPIDAEELLEHLEACLQNGRSLSNLYDLSEIVRYVKSMPTVTASPWHSVEEPPDTDEYVHAFDGAFVGMASFDGEKWWQHDTFESFIIAPSYWMPRIPDPQKEDA